MAVAAQRHATTSTLVPFHNKVVRLRWLATVVANIGRWMYNASGRLADGMALAMALRSKVTPHGPAGVNCLGRRHAFHFQAHFPQYGSLFIARGTLCV